MNEKEADEILAEAFGMNGPHAELPPAKPLKRLPKKAREHLLKGAGKSFLMAFPIQDHPSRHGHGGRSQGGLAPYGATTTDVPTDKH